MAFILGIFLILAVFLTGKNDELITPRPRAPIKIKSIDTMKYSRDLARERLTDPEFDQVIEKQVSDIAKVGATHVALGTPYDSEFVPFLKKWVVAARKNYLKVWFRGNFAGWEKWFDYPTIDRETHVKSLEKFILQNQDLFEDDDIFTPCSECENGGPGDPRKTGDIQGFRNFLIQEYAISTQAFSQINKKVKVGYFSLNFDVAKLIMDPATTASLGGIVAIDHYVSSPEKLVSDATELAEKSGGKIVFGEFGAPIADIHGKMNQDQQADWINRALTLIYNTSEIIGVNYWVNVGGSTQIWDEEGNARKAVEIIKDFYGLKH